MGEVFERNLFSLVCEGYEGDVLHNIFHGQGVAKFVGGHIYAVRSLPVRNACKGSFQNGLLHGIGKMTWKDGVVYQGIFKNNSISGEGSFSWPDGRYGSRFTV
jgi:hypothetical protein